MLDSLYHSIDPVAFSIGSIDVRWYGLAYLFGFLATGFVVLRTSRRWFLPLSGEDVLMVIVGIAFGLIFGARLFYVLFYNLPYYLQNPTHILMFNEGGMSFHGGLVGAFVGGFFVCRSLGVPFGTMCDLVSIGAPIGLFFGRCANFINGELWGLPTDLPWGVSFESGGGVYRHPSQLYEALLEGIVLFLIQFALSHSKPPLYRFLHLGTFLSFYGVFRMMIELVRVPDVQIGYLIGPVTMGQVLSLPVFIAGLICLLYGRKARIPQTFGFLEARS